MANGDDLEPVLDPPKDDAMIAAAEAEAALPFAVECGHVANAELAEPRKGFLRMRKATGRSIARNCVSFRCEGEAQRRELVEQFLDHLRAITPHHGVARVGLGKTATDGLGKLRTDGSFGDAR